MRPVRRIKRILRKVDRDLRHRVIGRPWLDVKPDQCFLASYPRSGNTWMRHILYYYFYGADPDMSMDKLDEIMPLIDSVDLGKFLDQPNPGPIRFIKTHETCGDYLLKSKVIYIVRDGRDAVYSWYHYRQKLYDDSVEFDRFLDRCLAGRYRYGSWHGNVSSWIPYLDHPNLLLLRYEDLVGDVDANLRAVLAFLGVPVDENRLAYAIDQSSRERVGRTFQTLRPARNTDFRGTAGGSEEQRWKTTYSQDQLERFLAKSRPVLERFDYPG